RAEGSAARVGPAVDPGPYISALADISPRSVTATYCVFDDRVSYVKETGQVLNDSVAITHGIVVFDSTDGRWLIRPKEPVSADPVPPDTPNPCPGERIS